MRCRQCNYTLWAARGGKCPECGSAFKPRNYEFVPGSVRFACPHCDQEYYSSESHGHLEPRAFQCVACDKPLHMDSMILTPAEGFENTAVVLNDLPWLRRQEVGFLRAWFQTLKLSLNSPGRMMARVHPSSSARAAWAFAAITMAATALVAIAFMFAWEVGRFFSLDALWIFLPMILLAPVIGATWITMVYGPWAGATHLVLAMTGRVNHGPKRTYQAMGYSTGPMILAGMSVPGWAAIVGLTWWWIGSVFAVREAHKVSTLRALTAVSALPTALIAAAILSLTLGVGQIMINGTPITAPAPTPATAPATLPVSAP